MRLVSLSMLFGLALAGCSGFSHKIAIKSTSAILLKASAGIQMESDYELARQAIPASLKTVEGFYVAGGPAAATDKLVRILTEGFCQYGTAFVEDDWEAAKFAKDLEAVEYHNTRSIKVFTRCFNYALKVLGPRFEKDIFGDPDTVAKLLKDTPRSKRFALLFAGMALGSLVNHNLTQPEMLALQPTIRAIMHRVLEMDAKGLPVDPEGTYGEGSINRSHAALPYIVLGMLSSAAPQAMGGDPALAKAMFEKALAVTDNKFLLARTLLAYRVGMQTNDRKLFHDQLKQVLETAPNVWPEQRLANEFAHRKARRYLAKEKELFQ